MVAKRGIIISSVRPKGCIGKGKMSDRVAVQPAQGVYKRGSDFLPGPVETGQGLAVPNRKRVDLDWT